MVNCMVAPVHPPSTDMQRMLDQPRGWVKLLQDKSMSFLVVSPPMSYAGIETATLDSDSEVLSE